MSIKVKVNGQWIEQTSNNLDGAVLYNVTQALTQEEQNKARENINTPSFDDIPDSISDLYNDSNFLSETDATLQEAGKAADAQAVGVALTTIEEALNNIGENEEYYTTNINVDKEDNIITITSVLEDGRSSVNIVELDDSGMPAVIKSDDFLCTFNWDGFSDV